MFQQPWVEALCGLNGLTHTALQYQLLDLCREQEHGSERGATNGPHSCSLQLPALSTDQRQSGGLAQSAMPVEMLTEEAEERTGPSSPTIDPGFCQALRVLTE